MSVGYGMLSMNFPLRIREPLSGQLTHLHLLQKSNAALDMWVFYVTTAYWQKNWSNFPAGTSGVNSCEWTLLTSVLFLSFMFPL